MIKYKMETKSSRKLIAYSLRFTIVFEAYSQIYFTIKTRN